MGVNPASLDPVSGHGAKIVTAGDITPGLNTGGYGATLYVLAFGDLQDGLTYTLEDSEDDSDWATATGPVNGVEAQTVVVTGVANTPVTIYVKHAATRRYHRLKPTTDGGDNFCSVVAIKLQPDQELSSAVDFYFGS